MSAYWILAGATGACGCDAGMTLLEPRTPSTSASVASKTSKKPEEAAAPSGEAEEGGGEE